MTPTPQSKVVLEVGQVWTDDLLTRSIVRFDDDYVEYQYVSEYGYRGSGSMSRQQFQYWASTAELVPVERSE